MQEGVTVVQARGDECIDSTLALLLHVARKQAIEVYNTFSFTAEDEGKYENVIEKFSAYCNPKKNETSNYRESQLNRLSLMSS